MNKGSPLVWAIVSMVFLMACSPTFMPQASSDDHQWTIVVNLYSGRVNPQGLLTVEQSLTFEDSIGALETGPSMETGGLGYTGFTLYPDNASAQDIDSITVYNGTVTVVRSDQTHYLADPDRALEGWLFESTLGSEWLSNSERQIIQQDLFGIGE